MSFRDLIAKELEGLILEDLLTETTGQVALFTAKKANNVTEAKSQNLLGQGFGRSRGKRQDRDQGDPGEQCLVEISLVKPNALDALESINDKRLILPNRVAALPENFGAGFYSAFSVRGLRLDEVEKQATRRSSIGNCPQSILAILSRLHFSGFTFGEILSSYCLFLAAENSWGLLASAQLHPAGETDKHDKDLKSFHSLFFPLTKDKAWSDRWKRELPGLMLPPSGESTANALRQGPFLDSPPPDFKVKALKGSYEIRVTDGNQSSCGLISSELSVATGQENKTLNFADLPSIGEVVGPVRECHWEIPFGSERSYLVYARVGEWIRLGKVISLSSVPDITSLSISQNDGRTRLFWDWHDSLEVAIVRFLDERDNVISSTRVFDYQYQAQNGFVVETSTLERERISKIQVLGAAPAGRGSWKTSSGLPDDCWVRLSTTC